MTTPYDETRLPLYEAVKRALRETIARGEFVPGAPFVTERRVCEEFGVSKTTAVRALNELVAEGVLVRRQGSGTFVAERSPAASVRPVDGAAVSGLAAEPPGAATQTATVACILQGATGPHVTKLLAGVEATCSELGYRMYMTQTQNDPAREGRALREALESRVSGIVLYPVEGHANAEIFAEVRRRNVALVMVDRYRPDVPTDAVVADNIAVGYQVTAELIRMGHSRILTLWQETDCSSIRDRLTGHIQALRDKDIRVRPELTALRRYGSRSDPEQSGTVEALLARPEPPTVLLCANGYALARAVEDLVRLGMEVPGRVDLAGMDDAGPFDILPLTAVAATLPSREMGQRAVELLHERISSGRPYDDVQNVVLPITIRTRDSAPGHLRVVATE